MISRWEKIFLGLSVLLAAATGLTYAWMKFFMKTADPISVVNHPWQPVVLSAHVLAAPLLLFALGLIARDHILGRFRDPRSGKARPSGLLGVLAMVPMVATGYLTQVLTSAEGRRTMGLVHLGAGLGFLAAYAYHVRWRGRRAAADGHGEEESAAPGSVEPRAGPAAGSEGSRRLPLT